MRRIAAMALFCIALGGCASDSRAGQKALQRAQEAMGGAEMLASIKDMIELSETAYGKSGDGAKWKEAEKWIVPDRLRFEIQTPSGKSTSYTDGTTGWEVRPEGADQFGPAEAEEGRGELFHELLTLILSDRDTQRSMSPAKDNAATITFGGQTATMSFDRETG